MNKSIIRRLILCLMSVILIFVSLASCAKQPSGENTSEQSSEKNSDSFSIVTTIFPIYDWVRNITGSDDGITYLECTGVDVHSYDPTANDIAVIASADVFIYVGGISDKWVDNAIEAAKNPNITKISLMDAVTGLEEESVEGMEPEEEEETGVTEIDEHIWLSVRNAEKSVSKIATVLEQANPEKAEEYKANADAYLEKLSELDAQYTDMVSTAKRNTVLFADRFPFRYLVEDYNIDYYAAFAGCSSESEASFETMTILIEKTKELNLPYIIVLENSQGKIADTISSSTGAKILTVNSCQSVTTQDISNGMTYLTAMVANLETFREALN